jgi:hypothetical protein
VFECGVERVRVRKYQRVVGGGINLTKLRFLDKLT